MPEIIGPKNGLRDVILAHEPKQQQLVNTITENAPIIGNDILFMPASHNIINKYEKAREVQGPKRVDLDAPLKLMNIVTDLKETKLFKIAGLLELPEDRIEAATEDWVAQWMARKLPIILQAGMSDIERSYLYDSLLATCLESPGRTINMNNAASGANYFSIMGCVYDEGQNCGLYNPNRTNAQGGAAGAGNGEQQQSTFFRMNVKWGGGRGDLSNGATGFAWDVSAMLGYQHANEKKLAAIVNIDEDHFPTYKQIIEFARMLKGQNVVRKHIYMPPTVSNIIISKYSNTDSNNSLITVGPDGRLRILGIAVTESENFVSGEDAIPAGKIA